MDVHAKPERRLEPLGDAVDVSIDEEVDITGRGGVAVRVGAEEPDLAGGPLGAKGRDFGAKSRQDGGDALGRGARLFRELAPNPPQHGRCKQGVVGAGRRGCAHAAIVAGPDTRGKR